MFLVSRNFFVVVLSQTDIAVHPIKDSSFNQLNESIIQKAKVIGIFIFRKILITMEIKALYTQNQL